MVFTHPLNAPHPTATTHIRHQLWRTRKMAHSLVLLLRSTSLPDDLLLLFARTWNVPAHQYPPPPHAHNPPSYSRTRALSLSLSLSLSISQQNMIIDDPAAAGPAEPKAAPISDNSSGSLAVLLHPLVIINVSE